MELNLPFRIAIASMLVMNLAASPMLVGAQEAPSEIPTVTLRTNTRLVLVDVVVTDKKGQPVSGLKAENFTVDENGKKQKITVFVAPGTPSAIKLAPTPAGILSNHPENVGPASGVPTVLLLDVCNSPFKDQSYARSQMLKYVVEQGQSGHPLAVMTLTDRVRVLQQFTSDPQVLMTAIKKLRPQEQVLASAGPAPETHGISTVDIHGGSGTPAMTSAIGAATVAVQQFADIQVGYNLERRTTITIEAMRSLARILAAFGAEERGVADSVSAF